MVHEIDDTDIKILEAVTSYIDTFTNDIDIQTKVTPQITIVELDDRLDLLGRDEFVNCTTASGRWYVRSTPKGRQFLRDRPATHKK